MQKSEATRACNESGENTGEENKKNGNDRSHAIWLYAWEGHDSCIVYSQENARGVSRKKAKAVHVFCGLRKGI